MTTTTSPAESPAALPAPTPDPVGWEPAGAVYCAVIVTDTATGGTQQVVSTRWASEGEARAFIERRLPAVAEERAGTKVSGFVMPARTHTRMAGGELVQDVIQEWGAAVRGRLNPNGYVSW